MLDDCRAPHRHPVSLGSPGPDPDTVTGLRRAIDARRTVSFRYTDAEGANPPGQ
jgi:predicted DNA-binding transcriptional regulator YafY